MRTRRLFGLLLAVIGLALAAASLAAATFRYVIPFGSVTLAVLAILILVVGLIILITEAMERWLSDGQAALVDDLQAG